MTDEMTMQMLSSWKTLNKDLLNLREDQLKMLINFEVSTKKRPDMIARMHARYSKMQAARVRAELLAGETLL